ncbi:MAG: phosphatase PAP2 family protein [Clostridia bacterium]|nr:phosphatase PAP2 family protein [Clostridia bacterium]
MWEIEISQWFYHPTSIFASIFDLIGEAPAVIPFVYFLVVLVGIITKRTYFTKNKWEHIYFALYLICVVVMVSTVVATIKHLWGRARFVDLNAPDYIGYTPFYQPSAFGGSAFPSGHASMSTLSVLLYDINKKHRIFAKNGWILAFSVLFTACVVVSRLIAGAHFITDLIFGVLIALVVRAVSKLLYQKLISKSRRDL